MVTEFQSVGRDITDQKRADEALRESEKRFHELSDLLPEVVYEVDTGGNLKYTNHIAFERFGYTGDDFKQGLNVMQMLAPEDLERAGTAFRAMVERDGRMMGPPNEYMALRKDGSTVPITINSSPIVVNGRTTGFRGIIVDITERKRADKELQESGEKYRLVVENSHDAIYIYRSDRLLFANSRASTLTGYPHDELMGIRLWNLVHPDDRDQLIENARKRFAGEKVSPGFTARLQTKNGISLSCEFFVDIIMYQGSPAILGIARDITERKKAEEALRVSEERYRRIVETTDEGVAQIDEKLEFVYVNNRMAEMHGYTPEEMIGQNLTFFMVTEEIPDNITRIKERRLGKSGRYVRRFVTKGGKIRWMQVSVTPLFDPDGTFRGSFGMYSDITDRKAAEEALKGALKKLNMLSSITRHDILNQIMGLRTYLELSREELKGTRFAEYIEKEDQAAEAIQRKIEFTKFYQDIGVNAPKWQEVAAVIHAAASQLNLPAIEMKVTVTGVEIFADPLIQKVFYNLMENSLRHGERVTMMEFSSRESEAGLVITFRDNGGGISAEDKKKLFQKGYGKHTGLGLYLSREILTITGITIIENGKLGTGVRFEMTVPKDAYRFTYAR
jgi:PAS domain S-box-containing protein